MPNPTRLNFDRWLQIAQVLVTDVVLCRDEFSRTSMESGRVNQFWARAFVRAFFAYVESSVFEMRLVVRDAADGGRITLTVAERSLIDEESYEIAANGKPEARTKFLKLERNFRFTSELFGRAFAIETGIEYGDGGWESFLGSLKIRHRITHPRDLAAIDLTLPEVQTVVSAFAWYIASTDRLLARCTAAMQAETARLLQGTSTAPLPPPGVPG